jgi:hypothetical protein
MQAQKMQTQKLDIAMIEARRPTTSPSASMRTHFFSTSAGFWEKVAMLNTLFWDPGPGGVRAFLVAWFGERNERTPKRK